MLKRKIFSSGIILLFVSLGTVYASQSAGQSNTNPITMGEITLNSHAAFAIKIRLVCLHVKEQRKNEKLDFIILEARATERAQPICNECLSFKYKKANDPDQSWLQSPQIKLGQTITFNANGVPIVQ